jgi:hypothetical protein
MTDLRREPVRDRTSDPPVTVDMNRAEQPATSYGRPRHAREGEMNAPYARERAPAGAMSPLAGMATTAPAAIALLGGVWLVLSRVVLDYPAAGSTADGVLNGLIIGIAIALIALARMTTTNSNPVLGLVTAILGGWMIGAPWVFNYSHWGSGSRPAWSDVITGGFIALAGLATWLAGTARRVRVARRLGTVM